MKTVRLTTFERETITVCLSEMLASAPEEYKDAVGCTLREAGQRFEAAERVLNKLWTPAPTRRPR